MCDHAQHARTKYTLDYQYRTGPGTIYGRGCIVVCVLLSLWEEASRARAPSSRLRGGALVALEYVAKLPRIAWIETCIAASGASRSLCPLWCPS